MLDQYWADVVDGGPTLFQHVSYLPGWDTEGTQHRWSYVSFMLPVLVLPIRDIMDYSFANGAFSVEAGETSPSSVHCRHNILQVDLICNVSPISCPDVELYDSVENGSDCSPDNKHRKLSLNKDTRFNIIFYRRQGNNYQDVAPVIRSHQPRDKEVSLNEMFSAIVVRRVK